MPAFGQNQQEDMHVWEIGYAAAEAAGYFRWKKAKSGREPNPLAATAFVAGFMGGAFLGKLPLGLKILRLNPKYWGGSGMDTTRPTV
jgi:hypothetical protein